MNRSLSVAVAALAMAGCSANTPPPAAPAVNATSSKSPTAPATPAGSASAAAPTAAASAQPPIDAQTARTLSVLRDLAARYVESDGESGWRIDEQAATELEKLDRAHIAQLVPLLSDQDAQVRRGAAYFLLARFNPNEPQLVAAFSRLLADSDPTVRGFAVSAVRQMNAADQSAALPRLGEMLAPAGESKPENRAAVARLLASLKSQAANQADVLAVAAKDDPDPQVRSACLVAIASVAEPAQAATRIAPSLADEDASVRLVAAVRLRQLGAAAAPAAGQLAAALEDSDPRVSDAAAQSLVNIGNDAVGVIADRLDSNKADVRKLALACLIKIGPGAATAAGQIEKCLQDPDPQVKQLAAAALARIKAKP